MNIFKSILSALETDEHKTRMMPLLEDILELDKDIEIVIIKGSSVGFTAPLKEVMMSRYNVFSDRFQKKYINTDTFGCLPHWVNMVLRRQYEAKATGKWYGY